MGGWASRFSELFGQEKKKIYIYIYITYIIAYVIYLRPQTRPLIHCNEHLQVKISGYHVLGDNSDTV
jgi:hypothetical protein